jgi:hypothetical protein
MLGLLSVGDDERVFSLHPVLCIQIGERDTAPAVYCWGVGARQLFDVETIRP